MERQAVEPPEAGHSLRWQGLRGSFLNIVAASGVLWPGAQFTHQPASSESGESRARGAWGEADFLGDLVRCESVGSTYQTHDSRIELVERWLLNLSDKQRHAKAHTDFLEHRRRKTSITACRYHALNPASPLLGQAELMKHAADYPVAQL